MMMPDGGAPLPGHIMTHPELAATFEALAAEGREGFYTGRIAQAIVDLVASKGGLMTLDDLAATEADVVQPIKYDFRASDADPGISLWECPPNGQGLTALVALGIVEAVQDVHGVDVLDLPLNSAEYLHILIEALRLAFADSESA
jgi:gamma-glutamyltranspeptidase/glutathione hydrolase